MDILDVHILISQQFAEMPVMYDIEVLFISQASFRVYMTIIDTYIFICKSYRPMCRSGHFGRTNYGLSKLNKNQFRFDPHSMLIVFVFLNKSCNLKEQHHFMSIHI